MYWDKFIEASIIALGLSPDVQERLIVSSPSVTRSTGTASVKGRSQTSRPVPANPPAWRFEQD